MIKYAIGIDLGGTFIKYAVVSSDGKILFNGKHPSRATESAEAVVDQIKKGVDLCREYARKESLVLEGIGVGTPGIVSEDCRSIAGAAENIVGWEGVALASILEEHSSLDTLLNNDANLMALGETLYGAACGSTDVVFLTVGTGIGGGVLIGGKIYGGYKNRGTEIGHITINCDGQRCACGNIGCLERYATTAALLRRFAELSPQTPFNDISGELIVELYHAGNSAAVQALDEHCHYLSQGIISMIHIFSPQKIVIGGGISEAGEFYIEKLRGLTAKYAIRSCAEGTQIVAAKLGNNAGCLGAAGLILNR